MHTFRSSLVAGLILASSLGACSAGAAAPASTSPTPPPPTEVPGGLESPDTGVVGIGIGGGGGGEAGQPQFVLPRPGTQNPRPVSVESLEARVDGRNAVVVATWWSGVEPCYVLDSAAFEREGNTITVSLTEGAGQGDAMCIELAVEKATALDLGELEPGEYTVMAAEGPAEPITFTIG